MSNRFRLQMTMLSLNIAIATFAFFGSLTAFGGETWRHGDQFFLRRVTFRGWIALICLIAAFCLGIAKEIQATEAAGLEASERSRLESENATQLATIEQLQAELNQQIQNTAEAIMKAADNRRIKTERGLENGWAYLEITNETTARSLLIKQFAYLNITVIGFDGSGFSNHHLEFVSDMTGSIPDVGDKGTLFAIRVDLVYQNLKETIDEITDQIPGIEVRITQTDCIHLSYSDDWGGDYNNYLVFTVNSEYPPTSLSNMLDSRDAYESIGKTYEKLKDSPEHFLSEWSDEEEISPLAKKIIAFIR